MFYRTWFAYVSKIELLLDILQDSEPHHKKNRKHYAICNQVLQCNKECLECVKPERQVPRIYLQ